MDPITQQTILSAAGATGGGAAPTGFLPIMAIKAFDDNGTNPPTANTETPFRSMLSFDTANTTAISNTSSMSSITSILDTSKYTVNTAFGTGGYYLKSLRLEHWQNSSTLYNYAEMYFDGTQFNIYDHACNVQSGLAYANPSQLGTIQQANLDGSSITVANKVFINVSTKSTRDGNNNWTSDGGDYCFIMITDKSHTAANSDNFDSQLATNKGFGFGISDADGAPSSGQAPKDGISRRGSYKSLLTNWPQISGGPSHAGNTVSGYFVLRGEVR